MNLSDPAFVFTLASQLALPAWLWLIVWLFLPQSIRHRTRFVGLVVPLLHAVLYAGAALVHFSGAEGDFGTLDGVLSLFAQPGTALAGWIHYLSFDLFVGWCITQHAVMRRVNRLLVVPCLLLTFMLGPSGLLVYGSLFAAGFIVHQLAGRSAVHDPLWRQVLGGQSSLAQCGLFLCCMLPLLFIAQSMDTRTVLDVNVWTKPIKFAVSLLFYTLTLSWYSNYLADSWRRSRWFNGFAVVVVIAVAVEMIWLIFAAAIGEPSHFNRTHPLLAPLYSLMGVLAVILTAQSLVIGIGLLAYADASLHRHTRYCLAYSLIATFFLTVAVAGYLAGSTLQSHAVLADGLTGIYGGHTMPLTGWLREAGDLRVAHFFATHALHFLPLAGLLIARIHPDTTDNRKFRLNPTALTLTSLYCLGVLLVFIQALHGRPFI